MHTARLRLRSLRLITLATCLAAAGAMAHTGVDAAVRHGAMFMDGLLHPWTGLDHLAAMLAVGLWSAMTARRWWVAPLAFANMLLVGALLGLGGIALPAVEPVIAVSLLVLGLLVALRTPLPATVAAAMVGLFAVFHGVAHGVELSAGPQAWAPLAGMLLSTVALHLAGVLFGHALRTRTPWWPRAAGASVALLGGSLLLQVV